MEGKDQLVTLELPHLVRDGNHLQESVVKDSDEQVDEQDVGDKEVAGHDGRNHPGPWDVGR